MIIETVRLLSARPGEEYDPTRNGNGGPVGPPPGNLARPTQWMVTANPSCPTLKSYSDERIANPLQNGVRLTLRPTRMSAPTPRSSPNPISLSTPFVIDPMPACAGSGVGMVMHGAADTLNALLMTIEGTVRQAIKVVADFVAALH